MALDNDNIKDLFSSKLNSFEPEVPASIWGGIDQLLSQVPPAQAPDASSSQASNTASSTATEAGGTALKTTLITVGIAASIAAGVFMVYDPSDVDVPQIVEEIQPKEITVPPQVIEPVEETTKVLAQADFVRPGAVENVVATIAKDHDVEEAVAAPQEEAAEAVKEATAEERAEVFGIDAVEELPPLPLPKFLKEDISIGIRTNAGALSSDVNENGGNLLFSGKDRSSEFSDALKDENKEYELDHKQPISVGITVSKTLSRNLSLETGLMFTYLSSRITSNSFVNIKEEQTFGYLGIPIYLNYNFFELHKAKFYISLGAMMQKDVYGKYTSRLISGASIVNGSVPAYILYAEPSYMKKNISQSHWQLSSHLTLGVSYPIYRKLYIYTSVGGAYYFDAGNEYRTIYSDRQFQLDLNLGLRFDF